MTDNATPIQGSLFEAGYLQRSLGAISNEPLVALTELVANAWDAGASKVDIVIPNRLDERLAITDDGIGMTRDEFYSRWMTLGYNRVKNQGKHVEFPPGRQGRRLAFGRNGVGRHGLLCFSDEYHVLACPHEWIKLAKKAKLGIRFHDLRHTHASVLLKQGVHPKWCRNVLVMLPSQ
jgi:Histidine kinase-, DNA gyrase B-, and HSP90-like ATPase